MKKWISLLMALLMALSLLPATAVAAEPSEPVQPEVLQSEEPVQEEVSQKEEEQLPELMLAETEENAPAVLSASDDLDTQLSSAGFTVPKMGSMNGNHRDFYPEMSWQGNDCVSFDYDDSGIVGKLTVTLKKATQEKWKALYDAALHTDYDGGDHLSFCASFAAPASAVRGAGARIEGDGMDQAVSDFLNDNIEASMYKFNSDGSARILGRLIPLVSVEKRDGKAVLSAPAGESVWRCLVVWDDNQSSSDGRLAKYNVLITVKAESDIYYTWEQDTMEEALRNAGYRVPAQKLFDVDMPDGLVEGVDYTYSYDASTGHVSIQLLQTDGWMKAFETYYKKYGDYASDYFDVTACFNQPSTKAKSVMFWVTDIDDWTVKQFAKNDFSEFDWYTGTKLRPGSTRTIIETGAKDNGDMWLFAKAGTYWVRCIVVWGDANKNVLTDSGGEQKYMYTVSIEVPEGFDYEWNSLPIQDQLTYAGFTAPKLDKNNEGVPGALTLKMPEGLKSGTDYLYTYNEKTGELNITIKRGNKADWKAAYLDSAVSGCTDDITMDILFGSEYGAVQGVSWVGDEANLGMLLWDGIWYDNRYASDVRGDFSMRGNGCAIADVKGNGNGTVTISGKKGTTELYHAVMWKDDAGNVLSKYLVKVKITVATAFSHTAVATPMMDRLNAADPARVKMELYAPNALMTSISTKGQVMLVPKAGTALTDEAGYIGGFWVQAPAGYTLQSCYLDYAPGQNADLHDFEINGNSYWIPVDFYNPTVDFDTLVRLAWKNNNANAADLIESLDVCIDSNWGKLSNHGGAPNALDVAAIYECLTQDKTPACGSKEDCDVNLDGDVDVFDLQYLYECVAQNR